MDYTSYATPSTEWLAFEKAQGSPPNPDTLPETKEFNAARARLFREVLGPVDDVQRQDVTIAPYVTGRIYRQKTSINGDYLSNAEQSRPPLYIHYHGGGYYYGDLDTDDIGCALICKHSGAIVLSVNYRHTPQWSFPIPIQDAWDSFLWAMDETSGRKILRYDKRRVIVAGASAGAALAIAVVLKELEQVDDLRLQNMNIERTSEDHMAEVVTSKNEEGMTAKHLETTSSTSPEAELLETLEHGDDLDGKVVRRLIRRVDLRIMPALGLLYALSLIDRVNISIARIAGMDSDLQLSVGNRYSLCTMMLFVTYILFDFPGNIAMRKVGPAIWLPGICFAWGVVTIGMGFCNSWGALLACRTIFGALEGGLFPGCVFLLSCWYTRFEIQKRFSGFYCLGMLASGFSSILGFEIQKMKGFGGLNGWRWIFILEGLASCVVAVIGFLLLIDFPDKASRRGMFRVKGFLTTHEAAVILARIERDRGDASPEKLTLWAQIRQLKDPKIWEMTVLLLCNNCVAYSFAFFLPTILSSGFGFSLERTYELNFPPYVLAAIWMFASAFLGDKLHVRGPLIVFSATWTIIGLAMMGYLKNNVARYAGVFLAVASANSNIPAIFSYQHNNIVGQTKKSIAAAMMIAGGGVGGIIASNVFRQQDAPQYLPGLNVVISLQTLTIILVSKNFWYFRRQNRKADRGDFYIEGQPGFRYTY